MNYNYCIRLWIKTIVFVTIIVLGTTYIYTSSQIYRHNHNNSESEIEIEVGINKQFGEVVPVVPAYLQVEEQNNSDSDSEEFKQLKWFLNKRFWDLRKNSSAAEDSNETFFTRSRLLDFQTFSLFRPNSENNKASFFNNDDRITALHVLGMEGLPKNWILKPKRIYLPNSYSWWNLKPNDHNLTTTGFDGRCVSWKINQCILTASKENLEDIDLIAGSAGGIISRTSSYTLGVKPETKYLYYELESPFVESLNIPVETANRDWLSSFWKGSDITTPYARWVYYDLAVTKRPQEKNFAKSKTKFGAIFMSNCRSENGRIPFINKLQAMVQIDMYGHCGTLKCNRNAQECLDKLREEYKFYFAFENANCQDYITEKFFMNALLNDVIPVVFGAHPDDYKLAAPANSYIHVEDFDTTEDLVNYLKYLDSNDTAYNSYFEWKGTGQFIDTKYFCRVCTLLHYHDYLMHNMEDRPNNNNNEVQESEKSRNGFQLTPVSWNSISRCSKEVFWKKKRSL